MSLGPYEEYITEFHIYYFSFIATSDDFVTYYMYAPVEWSTACRKSPRSSSVVCASNQFLRKGQVLTLVEARRFLCAFSYS